MSCWYGGGSGGGGGSGRLGGSGRFGGDCGEDWGGIFGGDGGDLGGWSSDSCAKARGGARDGDAKAGDDVAGFGDAECGEAGRKGSGRGRSGRDGSRGEGFADRSGAAVALLAIHLVEPATFEFGAMSRHVSTIRRKGLLSDSGLMEEDVFSSCELSPAMRSQISSCTLRENPSTRTCTSCSECACPQRPPAPLSQSSPLPSSQDSWSPHRHLAASTASA